MIGSASLSYCFISSIWVDTHLPVDMLVLVTCRLRKQSSSTVSAYGPDRVTNGMERPPGTIPLETLGDVIAQLFIRSFVRGGSNSSRPDAKTWVEAIENLKSNLRVCSQASWHHYPRALAACPWCAVELQTGLRLFGQRIATVSSAGTIDLATLWRDISAVSDPGVGPTLPCDRPWHPPPDAEAAGGRLKIFRKILSIGFVCMGFAACTSLSQNGGAIVALALYGLAFAVWPRSSAEQQSAADKAYLVAKDEWESAVARWKREASRDAFAERLKALEKARTEIVDLPNERQRRLAYLEAERETRQRQRYLDRFRIDRANIRGIGVNRSAMLASYGIESAADIESATIRQIPGFGTMLTSELVQWRQGHERNFRFNPNEPLDRRDIDAIDRELETRKQNLFSTLQQGALLCCGGSAKKLMPPAHV